MKDRKPLSYVENRSTKTYPTEVGSANFKPEDLSLFKKEKNIQLKNYYTSKFEEIQNQYNSLMEDIQINERIYNSKYSFQPVIGNIYYLYKKETYDFLSMISPSEWGHKFELIGTFRFNSDGRWTKIED